MATYKLKPLLALEQRGVIEIDVSGPALLGDGPDNYTCPKCGNIIAKSVKLSDLTKYLNAAFKCYNCKQISKL
ncbi:hypothetical protein ACX93W_26605 [Paenibacillus sp. CAU 1782]